MDVVITVSGDKAKHSESFNNLMQWRSMLPEPTVPDLSNDSY